MLEVTDAGRRIDGDWIWRHLSFRLKPGERLGLVGPSGSGKTLLLRSLAGLDALDEGCVKLDGHSVEEWAMPEYRSRVAYLPQDAVLEEGTVRDALRLPFGFASQSEKTFDEDDTCARLDTLDRNPDFLGKETGDLSGGERQVTALVRVLLLKPDILLLDEPAASMDDSLARGAETLVSAWLDEDRSTRALIWTSHLADRLDRVTDRRLTLTRYRS